MSESIRHSLSFYESTGEIELGRGDVISTIDLASFPGSYPVYSSSAVGLGEFGRYGRYMFDEELITWSIDGGGRPFHRKKHRFSVTNVCGFLRIKRPDLWDYRYLHALLEKLQSGIQFDYQMKAHPSVIRELYQFERTPIVKQRKIGQILGTLDTAIRETEALIDKLKAVKQGLLHDLLTRGIEANGQLRPPQSEAPQLYKESPLGWIPRDWGVQPLAAYTASEITYGIVQAGPHKAGGVPYIRTGDMSGDALVRESMLCTSRRIANSYVRSEVRTGEIVMAIRATVGKVLPVPDDLDGANLTQGTARISPNSKTDGAFLLWAIRHSRAQQAIQLEIKGTTFAEITLGALRQVPIAAPMDISEQREIAKRLTAIDERLRVEQEGLAKRLSEKSGLMDDLLTGRVRVNPLLESVQQSAVQTGA